MKLDSEDQRQKLIGLLAQVKVKVTPVTIGEFKHEFDQLFLALQNAGLEKQVVPIESLAPDPPDLKVESGGQ